MTDAPAGPASTPVDAFTRRTIERFFQQFMPQLEIAGRYALSLQRRVGTRDNKDGDAWASAITDADLGVQHYLEAFVLAECPDWHLHGEEHAQSFNTRYLPADARVQLVLDPINGTRLYRDGADSFDILLSLVIDGRLVATLSLMPARGLFYGAARGSDAFVTVTGAGGGPRKLDATNRCNTLAVYRADSWRERLPRDIEIFDIERDYRPDDLRCCMNSIFTGELGGYLFGNGALLDVGATAFTASRAGGIASLPDGGAFDYFDRFAADRSGPMLVCTNPALHAAVSGALSANR